MSELESGGTIEVDEGGPSLIRGRLLLFLAAVLWSTGGVLIKSPPLHQMWLDYGRDSAIALACCRALAAAVFLLPFTLRTRKRFTPAIGAMTLAFASMNVCFVLAIIQTTAAAAIFLQYTCTVWTFLLAFLFLKESIDRRNLMTLLAAIAGISIILYADRHSQNATGNMFALASGFSLAVLIVLLRALRREDPVWLMALCHLAGGLILLPWVFNSGVRFTPIQLTLAVVVGLFQMGLPYVIFTFAVKRVPVQEASLILLVEPVLNPVWVWLLWREPVGTPTLVGGGLILGGLAFRYLRFERVFTAKT